MTLGWLAGKLPLMAVVSSERIPSGYLPNFQLHKLCHFGCRGCSGKEVRNRAGNAALSEPGLSVRLICSGGKIKRYFVSLYNCVCV